MTPWTLRVASLLVLTPAVGGTQLGSPPVPPENPITETKRILGKALFWEEQLSSENTVACGTCHFPSMGGSDARMGPGSRHPGLNGTFGDPDDKVASAGVIHSDSANDYIEDGLFGFEPQVTGRRAPSHIGAAFFEELFWDGRARSEFKDPETGTTSIQSGGALESQAVGPIVNSVEMAHEGRTWDDVRAKLSAAMPLALASNLPSDLALRLASAPSYPDLFADAYGDPAINAERIAFALATYQRTLVPNDTLWDRFDAGDTDALNAQQQQGLQDFMGVGRCVECHTPPLFSDDSFRNIGNRPIAEDNGRQGVTGNIADRGLFKVPSLRNVALRGRWFHNGDPQIDVLRDVVTFYNGGGGSFDDNKDPILNGLSISSQVAVDIAAFLKALTDERVALELPPFDRPTLGSELAANPEILGGGVAGSGGQVPALIVACPPNLGNAEYKVGLHNALGGSVAALRWSFLLNGPNGKAFGETRQRVFVLPGSAAGEGHATFHFELPASSALIGVQSRLQWVIADPAAPGGRARSEVAQLTFF